VTGAPFDANRAPRSQVELALPVSHYESAAYMWTTSFDGHLMGAFRRYVGGKNSGLASRRSFDGDRVREAREVRLPMQVA
jgi:hypothetical protein